MKPEIILLSVLCSLPACYTFSKIKKQLELNVADVLLIFSILYYILIPVKSALGGVFYREVSAISILNDSEPTLVYLCIAFYEIFLINIFITQSSPDKFQCLKITENFKIVNAKINSVPSTIVLYSICFAFILFSITNYSALSADNLEGDRIWKYAQNASFIERCIIVFTDVGFPVFFVLTIRYFFETSTHRFKLLKKIALTLGISCLLLGSRTQMMFVAIVSLVYIYSCYRSLITKKAFIIALACLISLPTVIFPISQQFRLAKVLTVESGNSHSFSDVVSTFFDSSTKKELVAQAIQQTDGRSMNVFIAFNESVNKIYKSTNGYQVLDNFLCLNPFHKPDPALDNINAIRLEGGGDIAESLFTVMYVDLGLAGIVLAAPLLLLLICELITFICSKVSSIFQTSELQFLPIVYILQQCVSIEGAPSIRAIYNPTLIAIFMFGIVFSLFNKFLKD